MKSHLYYWFTSTSKIYIANHIFDNVSGSSFGTTWFETNQFSVNFGAWTEMGSLQSLNYREFANFAIKLEQEVLKGDLTGAEIFLFTDNGTTEAAFHNGKFNQQILFWLDP